MFLRLALPLRVVGWRRLIAVVLLAGTLASAQSLLPPTPVPLEVNAAQGTSSNWTRPASLGGDPRADRTLVPVNPGRGPLLVNVPTEQARAHFLTTTAHGDVELELEFLVPAGSNSGVYLQGRYEVQLFDSAGAVTPTSSDAGGIYQRWDPARGAGKEGFEGQGPRLNVGRAPGLWQQLRIVFRAPRFDAQGAKTANARFLRVEQNGVLVQEDVEVTGPTRAALFEDEKPLGPLMLQGDHGAVAFRNMRWKLIAAPRVATAGVTVRRYPGEFTKIGEYDAAPAPSSTPVEKVTARAAENDDPQALVFEGTLVTPDAGGHAFSLETRGLARLQIDGKTVVETDQPGAAGPLLSAPVELGAGEHRFRLDYVRGSNRRTATLEWRVEGPGHVPQVLTTTDSAPPRPQIPPILIEPQDGIRVQRAFFPWESGKRLYTVAVGTPEQLNYSYDLELGTLLQVWRGTFLDMTNIWHERGELQIARATGAVISLTAKSGLTLGGPPPVWPVSAGAFLKQKGYRLEQNGQPVFLSEFAGIAVEDRISPLPDRTGLRRELRFAGRPVDGELTVLVAEAAQITPRGERGYVIGDRAYYIDVPADSGLKLFLRGESGRRQLIARLPDDVKAPLTYVLVW